jgi:hypothetical protein
LIERRGTREGGRMSRGRRRRGRGLEGSGKREMRRRRRIERGQRMRRKGGEVGNEPSSEGSEICPARNKYQRESM